MNVDYLSEIRSLDAWEEIYPLTALAYKMMMKLYHFAELMGFPDRFRLPNSALMARCGCSENSLVKARKELVNHGRIEYKRGQRRDASPEYAIRYFALERGGDEKEETFNLKFCGKTGGKEGGKTEGKKGGKEGGKDGFCLKNCGKTGGKSPIDKYIHTVDDRNGDIYTPYQGSTSERSSTSLQQGDGEEEDYYLYYHQKRARESEYAKAEARAKAAALTILDQAAARETYGARLDEVRRMIIDTAYPYGLMAEAISYTIDRHQDGALMSPYRYTAALLEDWRKRWIFAPEEIKNEEAQGQ